MITIAKTVGPDYCVPICNMIGGDLLDLNWKSCRTKTTKDLIAEADVFGIYLREDMATIKGRPLINIIVSSFNVPMDVLGVKYCSKHLAYTKPYLEQYNDKKICMDVVIFDGVWSVHKVGKILADYYHWITVLHGAEHVMPLFSAIFQSSQLSG